MKRSHTLAVLPLLGGLLFAACSDGDPTQPLTDDFALSEEDAIAVELLSYSGSVEAALAVASGPVTALGRQAAGMGMGPHQGGSGQVQAQVRHQEALRLLTQARERYQEALRLHQAGEPAQAALQAREARRLVARAGQEACGEGFALGAAERLEELARRVAGDPAGYHDAAGLMGELHRLAQRARERLRAGDGNGAAQYGVLGEQRHRQRQRLGETTGPGAALHVAMGAEAVALAGAVLDEQGADDEQLALLETAAAYQATAEAALAAGDLGQAIHLSDLAQWAALLAVVSPGGLTEDDVRMVAELAQTLYAEAVDSDPGEEEVILLRRARALIDHALESLEAGTPRGIGALWRAAVICSLVAG